MNKLTLLASLLLLSLTGCAQPLSSGQAFAVGASVPMGDEPNTSSANNDNAPAEKVGPPQVVYRIDKDRYIGMEDYTNCNNGHLYYHNDAKNIKTLIWKMSGGVFNYKGKIAWISTNDNMIAVPLVPDTYCSDRGCSSNLLSSPDGGKTFTDITFQRNSLYSVEGSKRYLIIVDNDAIYLKLKSSGGSYYNTIQYVPNENNELYNRRQNQFEIDTNDEVAKLGVPREALNDQNSLAFNSKLLSDKYHYSDSQLSDVDLKITEAARKLSQRPRPKDPDATSSPAGDSSFHCDVSLIPK